jgi:hypothetical protein
LATQPEDPTLTSGRREAIIVVLTWISALAYTMIYCLQHGYGRRVEDLKYVYGFPDWVFWGVIIPWGVCIAFSWIFASIWMRDEDLGEDPPGTGEADEPGLGS